MNIHDIINIRHMLKDFNTNGIDIEIAFPNGHKRRFLMPLDRICEDIKTRHCGVNCVATIDRDEVKKEVIKLIYEQPIHYINYTYMDMLGGYYRKTIYRMAWHEVSE